MEKTEKQKSQAGEWFFPSNKELQKERLAAKTLCHEFNQLSPLARKQANKVIKSLFGTANNAWIEPPFYCDYGYNIHVGKNFYANHGCVFLDTAAITIGDNVMLGPSVNISAATHPMEVEPRNKGLEKASPIVIGNNVWIGMAAQILPGVTIGDDVVVATGAVVTEDVPSGVLVAGVPAKVKRTIEKAST